MPLQKDVPFNLYNFRQTVGDPARSYLFLVHIPEIGTDETLTALARSTTLPGFTLQETPVAFQGMNINLAAPPTFEPIQITFLCDEAHELRRMFMKWQSKAYDVGTGLLGHSNTYKSDQIGVAQIARNGEIVCKYGLVGAFPKEVGQIEVAHENGTAVETFPVTIRYDYYIIVDQFGEQTKAAPFVRSLKSVKINRGNPPPAGTWKTPFNPQ